MGNTLWYSLKLEGSPEEQGRQANLARKPWSWHRPQVGGKYMPSRKIVALLLSIALAALVLAGCGGGGGGGGDDPGGDIALGGVLTDKYTGALVSGALVELWQTGSVQGSDLSDLNGEYAVLDLPDGTYTVRVTKGGYEIYEAGVVLPDTMDIELVGSGPPPPPVFP